MVRSTSPDVHTYKGAGLLYDMDATGASSRGASAPVQICPINEANLTTTTTSSSGSTSSSQATRYGADVHLVVVVDNPAVTPEVKRWLSDLRQQLQYSMRLRYHAVNQGASVTRNRCLDESLAECVIFWDDDVMPAPGCIAAYVAAFKQSPEVGGGVSALLQ